MSHIKKLLNAYHPGTEIRIRRLELLWEMNNKMNPITDDKNQESSAHNSFELSFDMKSEGEVYES
jgi:hypothetical protein